MADLFCANLDQLRAIPTIGLDNLKESYVGSLRRKFIYINNEGGQDDNETVIVPNDSPASGRWICPQATQIPHQIQTWDSIDKSSASLKDLKDRSATDLLSGTLHEDRLPDAVPVFKDKTPVRVITTDKDGNYQLGLITIDHISGDIPFAKINWESFEPHEIGVEEIIKFNPFHFDRDADNNVSVKLMSENQPGLAIPGRGIESDEFGTIKVIYGTGDGEALEGTTPLGGDLSGEHGSAVVDCLRNIPLTFFFNQLQGKDGYVLTLDVKNPNTPFFYLSPKGGSGGGGSDLPDIAGQNGALLTDGTKVYWGKISASMIKPDFAITSFGCSPNRVEIGQQVNNPIFNAAYNDSVVSAYITDNSSTIFQLDSPFLTKTIQKSYKLSSVGALQFSLTAQSSDGTLKSAYTSISWLAKRFYGHLVIQNDFQNAINLLQSSDLASSRQGTFTVNAATLEYIYYAIPSSFGSASFAVGGFSGGFQLLATGINITNSYGITLSYDLYRSDNHSLGSTTVNVS